MPVWPPCRSALPVLLPCSAPLQLLRAARTVPGAPTARPQACQHPTRPPPLRRLCLDFTDPCVELLLSISPSGNPCCILPPSRASQRGSQVRRGRCWCPALLLKRPCSMGATASTGPSTNPSPAPLSLQGKALFSLIGLENLNEDTLIASLAAVEGHVANTCPPATCVAPPPGQQQQQQTAASPLAYCPEFACYLERCLELAQKHRGLGPAPAVLLLQVRAYGLHL